MQKKTAKPFPPINVENAIFISESIENDSHFIGQRLDEKLGQVEPSNRQHKWDLFSSFLLFVRNFLRLPNKTEEKPGSEREATTFLLEAAEYKQLPSPKKPENDETNAIEPDQVELDYLYRKIANIHQVMISTGMRRLTLSFLDLLRADLESIISAITRLKISNELAFLPILDTLIIARNKLTFAMALFDVEEITPIYRLLIRNKLFPSFTNLLHDVLLNWPFNGTRPPGNPTTDPPPPPKPPKPPKPH